MSCPRLRFEHTALLVVDVQERLLPHMHDADRLIQRVGQLVDAANALDLPVLVTEQYRKGLGSTVSELADKLPATHATFEKLKFSACIEPVRETLVRLNRRTVLVCGIEAHVCVLQTCFDLLQHGMLATVMVDAVSSRRRVDQEVAVSRMVQAGVVPTTVESALLEIVHEAGGDRFKAILPLIR